MAEYPAEPRVLTLSDIVVKDRIRPVSEAGVEALLHMIEEHGFTTPVLVRKTRNGFFLVDGAHRVEAMRRRGALDIPVRVCLCTDQEAKALETGQNLAGASLSPLDEALFLAAYEEAYHRLHPETKRGVAGALARHGLATELSSFAETIADKRGISARQVQKMAAAGRRISRAEADQLRAAPRKTSMKDIEQIGKISDADERSAVVNMLAEGKAAKVATARQQYAAAHGHTDPIVHDPVDAAFKRLFDVWKRAPKAARRRFVSEVFAELSPLVVDEAGKRDEADVAALRSDGDAEK